MVMRVARGRKLLAMEYLVSHIDELKVKKRGGGKNGRRAPKGNKYVKERI